MSQVVLITGASTGFGREAAETMASKGYRVFATMRDTAGRNAQARQELEGKGIDVLDLDVTNQESVDAAVNSALQRAGQIDVVINNAGMGNLGITEAYTAEQFRELFETNVFGPVRVNRAVLPSMRPRQSGLLIHVSSVAGRVSVPYLGPYCASKFALEAIADALRGELAPFNIDSVLVEPGAFKTAIFGKMFAPEDTQRVAEYAEAGQNHANRIEEGFRAALSDSNLPPVSWVVDVFLRLIEAPAGQRPFRTFVGGGPDVFSEYNAASDKLRDGMIQQFGLTELLRRQTQGVESLGV